MFIAATVAVLVAVTGIVVGGATVEVIVSEAVGMTGVTVGVAGVAEAGRVVVIVGVGVTVTGVKVGKGVREETGVTVGVMNIGAPNSLQPKSGAAPVNPVIGLGGMGSPLMATYCMMPLSIAGD